MIEKSGKRYFTVREFATRAGVSNQAIYKQVANQLSTYVVMIDNQKYIDESALFDVYNIMVDNPVDNEVDNRKTNNIAAAAEDQKQGQSDVSKELIEMLKDEIKKKDQQIERLQERLDHAQDLIADMAQKAQYITAADKTEKIMMQQPKENVVESDADNSETATAPQEKTIQKRGFWKRLFK